MKYLLAIDPGNIESAYVVWNGNIITDKAKISNWELLPLISGFGGTHVVCERIASYGMPVGREVFETCFWSGRFWDQAVMNGLQYSFVERRHVKLHLCGQARAKDSNIIQALKDRFGDKGTKANPGLTYGLKADIWQAFALAVTCFDQPELMKPCGKTIP